MTYNGTTMIAQHDPAATRTQVHTQAYLEGLRYTGNIGVKSPNNCITELWSRSQKSASLITPGVFVDFLHASPIGTTHHAVTTQTNTVSVGFRWQDMSISLSSLFLFWKLLTFC
jgi:hypothetical protein